MSNLKAALKVFGLSDADIENLQAETPPEGFDAKDIANKAREHIIEIHETGNPRIKDEDVQGKIITALKDIKVKVAKELGIAQTRGEIEKMPIEDFTALVKTTKESITVKSEGDEKLKAELADFRQKYLDANQALENERHSKDTELAKIKADSLKEVSNFKRNEQIAKIVNGLDIVVPEQAKAAMIEQFKRKIEVMPWTINDDNTLTGENGSGLAIDFDKKGSFKTLNEAIEREFDSVLRKSQGSGGQGPTTIVHGIDTEKVSEGNKGTLAFLEAKG